jgi:hypothetical protein
LEIPFCHDLRLCFSPQHFVLRVTHSTHDSLTIATILEKMIECRVHTQKGRFSTMGIASIDDTKLSIVLLILRIVSSISSSSSSTSSSGFERMKRRVQQQPTKQEELPSHEQDLLVSSISSSHRKGSSMPLKSRKNRKSPRLSVWIFFYLIGFAVFIYVTWVGYSNKEKKSVSTLGTTSTGMPRSYTPVLVEQYDNGNNITLQDWEWPLIHIINTRFMQEQGNLTALGRSRLALFKIFCLPTMKHQSSQQFIWIIKTDPSLDPLVLQELVTDLQDYPNFFLVASNVNYRINEQYPGAWRGGAEIQDLTRSPIYTGNQTLLLTAMALRDQLPVLETRLDADDGLHVHFLEQVQNEALDKFGVDADDKNEDGSGMNGDKDERGTTPKWLYWCARRHMEWHWQDERGCGSNETLCQLDQEYGSLSGVSHSQLCITPGITVGFPVGVEEHEVPVHAHHLLAERIRSAPPEEGCGYDVTADCLIFVHTFIFEAIRSRTPTSAGMLNAAGEVVDNSAVQSPLLVFAYWNMLHESFGIQREQVKWMQQYLSDHLIDIARDNLLGQCTTGHSCKVRNYLAC